MPLGRERGAIIEDGAPLLFGSDSRALCCAGSCLSLELDSSPQIDAKHKA